MTRDPTVALYDSLARWQWWRRRLRGARGLDGLEIRKRLLPPRGDGPADGGAGLDRWLLEKVGDRPRARLLDVGCGFGASIWRWLDAGCARAVGVTPSGYQVRRARQVARQRGVADRATFACRALHDELPAGNDVVLAIEALGHTEALERALAGVRRALVDGGVFVWVEDLLREPLANDDDVLQLARDWRSPPLRDVAAARAAARAAGLEVVEEVDLTAQVPRRDVAIVDAARARLRRWSWATPPGLARRLHAAFHGGFTLERLYARGAACYRYLMLEPRAAT